MAAPLLKRISDLVGTHRFLRAMSIYPPYVGAGIRLTHVAKDLSRLDVEMRLHTWNQNFVGTHFGGSLFSMCDPFFMLMVMARLGDGYVVWNKISSIDFKKPGKGRVHATFLVPDARVAEIREAARGGAPIRPEFTIDIFDDEGQVVATVTQILHVREKRAKPDAPTGSA